MNKNKRIYNHSTIKIFSISTKFMMKMKQLGR